MRKKKQTKTNLKRMWRERLDKIRRDIKIPENARKEILNKYVNIATLN